MTDYSNTCMFRRHVSSYLTGRDFDKDHFLLDVDPVANEVILREDLLGPRVVDRVVDQVQSRLAVQVDPNRGWDASRILQSYRRKQASCPAMANPMYSLSHELRLAFPTSLLCQLIAPPADINT